MLSGISFCTCKISAKSTHGNVGIQELITQNGGIFVERYSKKHDYLISCASALHCHAWSWAKHRNTPIVTEFFLRRWIITGKIPEDIDPNPGPCDVLYLFNPNQMQVQPCDWKKLSTLPTPFYQQQQQPPTDDFQYDDDLFLQTLLGEDEPKKDESQDFVPKIRNSLNIIQEQLILIGGWLNEYEKQSKK
jgi:hypothetical protein